MGVAVRVRRVTAGYDIVRISDIEPIEVAGGLKWRPLRRALGVQAFGINAYVAENAGDEVVESHTEATLGHEEVYVVVSGRATFTLDEEEIDAPAGTIIHLADPVIRRHARAAEAGTTVLAIGGKPGEAYTPSAWESYFAVERFRAAGDHAAAIAELEQALEVHPRNAGVLYSLGCWQALAGRPEEAVASVRAAIERDPRYAEWSQDDRDLDSIRDRL